MLKLATLSLAALLTLASPAYAKPACTKQAAFPGAIEIKGDDLAKFRAVAAGIPEQVDLVLVLKEAPIIVVLVKGCVVGYGVVSRPAKGEKL